MDKERFSLLLLEPNEIYFEDFSVTVVEEDSSKNPDLDVLCGRLKMCSKSIVYDPKNMVEAIIKIAYKDCDRIYQERPGNLAVKENNILAISCFQYTEMLENNILAPYKFINKKRLFLFNMQYGTVDAYLNQLMQLKRASSLHSFEQNDMIATIVFSRYNRLKFDPIWLQDVYEQVIIDNTVEEINPLIMNPGRILLSNNGIYFQPYNNIQPYPVKKIPLKNIEQLTKRRYLLRHTGLEIKWTENIERSSSSSNEYSSLNDHILYISFRNEKERDTFYKKALEQEVLKITQTEPESMILKWQNGIISNYDYLLYLNSLADRTFQDLTQYPIFPWIISDYTSSELNLNDEKHYRDLKKPIGALNPERLARLLERCDEMGDPKFLYGSHYSAPGLVLFYLVRRYPKLMLCLQNGRFDHPDRMFNRVHDAFNNCLNNMSDFKELIPEFYDTSENGGDFLMNNFKINFGDKHDGVPVNHVILPPWADSPETFINILRQALESDYVSKNLNHWIDLIFGYKQRGDEALKSNNLFYHLCYEGSVDLDKIKDLAARHALEVQISEFGQIPKQLFNKPHVPKTLSIPASIQRESLEGDEKMITDDISDLVLYDNIQSHKDIISCVIMDNNLITSTGKDGLLKCYDIVNKRQLRSVSVGSLPLSCCVKISNTNTLVLGSWDNSIMTYNLDYGRVSNYIPAHDDAVSSLAILNDLGILVSGSWDCSVKVWKGFDSFVSKSFRLSDAMLAYLPLDEKCSCVKVARNQNIINVCVGTFTGEVILWTLAIADLVKIQDLETIDQKVILKHADEISGIHFNLSQTHIASCSLDGILQVCDIATGMTLFRNEHQYPLTALNWTYSDELLVLGDQRGNVYIWNMQTGTIRLKKMELFNGLISYISTSADRKYVCVAGVDNRYFSIKILNCISS